MRMLAFNLMLLHLTMLLHYGSAKCVKNWEEINGQCMRCGTSFSGKSFASYLDAQARCTSAGGNLATIVNKEQELFAFNCEIDDEETWIGYVNEPSPRFLDGTPFVNFSAIDDSSGNNGCFYIYEIEDWDEDRDCTRGQTFTCSRPYDTCLDLEMPEATSITYTYPDSSTPPTGKRWVGTVATYSCRDGYSLSGTGYRTCTDEGFWSGTESPQCVAVGVCAVLSATGDSTITFSSNVDSNSKYMAGTVATHLCHDGFKQDSGNDSRTCLVSGSWAGSPVTCKDDDNAMTTGLGVGLGVMTLLAAGLLISMLCRRTVPTPLMGPPMGPSAMGPPRPPMVPRVMRPPYPYRGRVGFGDIY